jgi:hypothetical protein
VAEPSANLAKPPSHVPFRHCRRAAFPSVFDWECGPFVGCEGVRLLATACAVVGVALLVALVSSDAQPRRSPELLRLALLNAARGESERAPSAAGGMRGGLTRDYRRGTRVTARLAQTAATTAFGQPTIAGIGGWGFEADLRLDPSNANRLYMSAPDSANADSSFIWRSLDGGKTFKWVPGAAPLGGKVTTCHGGGDTELAVDPAGRLYFNDLNARQLQRRPFR